MPAVRLLHEIRSPPAMFPRTGGLVLPAGIFVALVMQLRFAVTAVAQAMFGEDAVAIMIAQVPEPVTGDAVILIEGVD